MGMRLTQDEIEAKFRQDLVTARDALASLEKNAAWADADEDRQSLYADYLPALRAGAKLSRIGRADEVAQGADDYWAASSDIIGPY